MQKEEALFNYISNLPLGAETTGVGLEASPPPDAIDPEKIPSGVVTGTNLVEFDGDVDPDLRTAVTLSLLAAQRVAGNDPVIADPDQWLDRHNVVLRNLNWTFEDGGHIDQTFRATNVEVHKAIIPLLVAALGTPAASSLIITALTQLTEVDESAPWITLFDRESRRFNISEYHFTRVAKDSRGVIMRLAAARFDARYGRTQVLFFKVTDENARFRMANSSFRADAKLLRLSKDRLREKVARLTEKYLRELDLGD